MIRNLFGIIALLLGVLHFGSCASSSKSTSAAAPANNSTPVLWTATEAVKTPESAYYDTNSDQVFVSNVNGVPNEKDGNGYISRYTITGQLVQDKWVTGLNAPKGLRSANGTLWVTDIDEVVAIDIKTGKIKQRLKPKGAKFLNDIAIATNGDVYVSDMLGNRIYTIRGKKVSTFVEGPQLEGPNGLFVSGTKLVVAGWGSEVKEDFSSKTPGHLYTIDLRTKEIALITQTPLGNLDGLEMTKDGSFFVTDWMAGRVYKVSPTGSSTLLVEGLKGSADLGWIPSTNTIIVPRMMENQVSAYTVQ